ncbi:MAG: hypothetical protein N4A33_06095 [Bacteriovoracaceae bacterium]|jgi:hypothetical protein|nr:hypothetical protein [Bacteriovoracaceae bacterium]
MTKKANKLFSQLMELDLRNLTQIKLVHYKNYTTIIEKLLDSKKRYGAPVSQSISEIKYNLAKDLNFEKKMSSNLGGSLFQMFLIFFMGQIFSIFASIQLDITLDSFSKFLIIGWQLLGTFIFIFLFYKLKNKIFDVYMSVLEKVVLFKNLLLSRVPLSYAINELDIDSLSSVKTIEVKRFLSALERVKSTGGQNMADLDILNKELWLGLDFKFEKFTKVLLACKFIALGVFFLPSYLYTIYLFIGQLGL